MVHAGDFRLAAGHRRLGVSGDEGAVRKIILNAIRDHVDEVRVDTMGNVLAIKRARGKAKLRVMLDAHMDEIGLMVVGATLISGPRSFPGRSRGTAPDARRDRPRIVRRIRTAAG